MKTMHCVSLVVLSLGLGALMTGCVGAVDDEDVSMSTTDDAEQALMASDGAKAAIAEALSKAMAVGGGNAISIANAFAICDLHQLIPLRTRSLRRSGGR